MYENSSPSDYWYCWPNTCSLNSPSEFFLAHNNHGHGTITYAEVRWIWIIGMIFLDFSRCDTSTSLREVARRTWLNIIHVGQQPYPYHHQQMYAFPILLWHPCSEAKMPVTSSAMQIRGPAYLAIQHEWGVRNCSNVLLPTTLFPYSSSIFDICLVSRYITEVALPSIVMQRVTVHGETAFVPLLSDSISFKGVGALLIQGSWQHHFLLTGWIDKNCLIIFTVVSPWEWLWFIIMRAALPLIQSRVFLVGVTNIVRWSGIRVLLARASFTILQFIAAGTGYVV